MDFKKDPIIQVYSYEWLRDTGHNREGTQVIVADFYVAFETHSGRRFRHNHGFIGRVEHDDLDFFPWPVHGDKAAAERLASRIERHLALGGTVNLDLWCEQDPAYGSSAYEDLDRTGFFRQREIAEDRQAMWR